MFDFHKLHVCGAAGIVSASLLVASSALAQSDTSGTDTTGSGSDTPELAEAPTQTGSAETMTCSELTRMDTAVVPGTLYFVAGYHQGKSESLDLSGGGAMESSSSMTADSTTDTSTSTDTAATDTTGTTSTDTTSTDTASSDTSAATTTQDTATADSSMDATATIGRLTGFFEIPVEQIVTACNTTPDRTVSDVVEEQRGMSESQTN